MILPLFVPDLRLGFNWICSVLCVVRTIRRGAIVTIKFVVFRLDKTIKRTLKVGETKVSVSELLGHFIQKITYIHTTPEILLAETGFADAFCFTGRFQTINHNNCLTHCNHVFLFRGSCYFLYQSPRFYWYAY